MDQFEVQLEKKISWSGCLYNCMQQTEIYSRLFLGLSENVFFLPQMAGKTMIT